MASAPTAAITDSEACARSRSAPGRAGTTVRRRSACSLDHCCNTRNRALPSESRAACSTRSLPVRVWKSMSAKAQPIGPAPAPEARSLLCDDALGSASEPRPDASAETSRKRVSANCRWRLPRSREPPAPYSCSASVARFAAYSGWPGSERVAPTATPVSATAKASAPASTVVRRGLRSPCRRARLRSPCRRDPAPATGPVSGAMAATASSRVRCADRHCGLGLTTSSRSLRRVDSAVSRAPSSPARAGAARASELRASRARAKASARDREVIRSLLDL